MKFADTLDSCSRVFFGYSNSSIVKYSLNFINKAPFTQRVLLKSLLVAIEFSPFIFSPIKKTLSKLSLSEKISLFEKISKGNLYLGRIAFLSLRTLMTFSLFSIKEVRRKFNMKNNLNPFNL